MNRFALHGSLFLLLALAPMTQAGAATDSDDGARTRLLVVSGLGGDARFSDAFHEWSLTLLDSALASGLESADIVYLAEDPERDPARITGKSTSEAVLETLADLRGKSSDADLTWIVLIGHGSFRDGLSRINLPGPDLTDRDFAVALEGFSGKLVFVNTASASGGFLRSLSGDGRVVVTATKTPAQRNESVFGGKFAAAFEESLADGDQNGRVSILEAFVYARQEVTRHYETKNLLVTEQALLDDDGDGEGTAEPDPLGGEDGKGDGLLASRLDLGAVSRPQVAGSDDLQLRRAALQDRLDELRRQKSDLAPDIYEQELESLLIEIATIDRALRAGDSP